MIELHRPTIVEAAAVLLVYELAAMALGLPTWTKLSHRWQGAPAWGFSVWLLWHLYVGDSPRRGDEK